MNRLQHSTKQGEKEVFYEQKNCMISEWEKRDDCWTNIDSPGLVREQKLRGHLETRRPVLLDLSGYKKNGMRVLWKDSLESLRQEGTSGTGFILWRCTDLPGSGGAASIMSEVWKREAGKTGMACGQSLLHEANCLFCRTEVPDYDRKGCGEGVQSGLGYGEDIRQRIHEETASEVSSSSTSCNWYRRNIHKERAYLSDSGKRFGAWKTDLVWREG